MSTAPPDAASERRPERCALICGMKFTPLVFKLGCMVYVQTTGQNFTEVLTGAYGDGAMKCCPVRENKIIA